MTEPRDRDPQREPSPSELARALPLEPLDASLRMRVQRAARAGYEGREPEAAFFWQDTLVPGTLIVAGALYVVGALQKLVEIFG